MASSSSADLNGMPRNAVYEWRRREPRLMSRASWRGHLRDQHPRITSRTTSPCGRERVEVAQLCMARTLPPSSLTVRTEAPIGVVEPNPAPERCVPSSASSESTRGRARCRRSSLPQPHHLSGMDGSRIMFARPVGLLLDNPPSGARDRRCRARPMGGPTSPGHADKAIITQGLPSAWVIVSVANSNRHLGHDATSGTTTALSVGEVVRSEIGQPVCPIGRLDPDQSSYRPRRSRPTARCAATISRLLAVAAEIASSSLTARPSSHPGRPARPSDVTDDQRQLQRDSQPEGLGLEGPRRSLKLS